MITIISNDTNITFSTAFVILQQNQSLENIFASHKVYVDFLKFILIKVFYVTRKRREAATKLI